VWHSIIIEITGWTHGLLGRIRLIEDKETGIESVKSVAAGLAREMET
jgi:hypothetical protein